MRALVHRFRYIIAKEAVICVVTFFVTFALYAQNLDKIGKKDMVKVSGGISTNGIYDYSSTRKLLQDIYPRTKPFNWVLSGNINVSLIDFSFPLSFRYTNQEVTYSQPMNIVGISPRYKWVTGHFGVRSMTFSKYTFSGVPFLGVGMELKPSKKWNISAMYGRLAKAIPFSDLGSPAYRRLGSAFKVGYTNNGNLLEYSLFTGWDDYNSLAQKLDTVGVTPQSNVVMSLKGSRKFFKKITTKAEVARTAITRDTRARETEYQHNYDKVFVMRNRLSTRYFWAMNGDVTANLGFMNLGVAYERIEADYRTLGAYYFNNDFSNIALTFSTLLFKNKISISGNAGLMRNNTSKTKLEQSTNFTGMINIGLNLSSRINGSISYSNTRRYAFIQSFEQSFDDVITFDNIDTLNQVEIIQMGNAGLNYVLIENKKHNGSFATMASYTQTGNAVVGEPLLVNSEIYTGNLGYNHSFITSGTRVGITGNANQEVSQAFKFLFAGASMSIGQAFFKKKFNTSLSLTWNNRYADDTLTNRLYRAALNLGYTLKEKHNFSLNANYTFSQNVTDLASDFDREVHNFVLTAGYSYTFSSNLGRKKGKGEPKETKKKDKGDKS